MHKPRPIPTRYKGYHFRSRLEARWAVYYDKTFPRGYKKWRYEPERIHTSLGDYLPDFEITVAGGGVKRYNLDTGRSWIDGWKILVEIKPRDFLDEHERECYFKMLSEAAEALRCRFCFLVEGAPGDAKVYHLDRDAATQIFQRTRDNYGCDDPDGVSAARSARFEHGECGPT